MNLILWIHVVGGAVGLVAGFAALAAAKGAPVHRRVGRWFVFAMLAMGSSGALIAALTGVETSVIMGILAAYLVFTGFTTVGPPAAWSRWAALVGAGVALVLSLALVEIGIRGVRSGGGMVEGLPAPMAFLFATIALLAGLADLRVVRRPLAGGARRIARHLWRMCFALFIASASFFLGQTQVLPEPLRVPWMLAPPVLVPILAMGYWFWKTRRRPARSRAVTAPSPDLA